MRSSPFLALLLAVSAAAAPAPAVAAASLPSGHFTWTGGAAADFALPADLRLFSSWHDSKFNLDYKRYQQYAAPRGTYVDGAQVTIVSRAGKQLIVAGAYYAGAHSARSPGLSVSAALAFAASARGGLTSLPDLIRPYATRRTDLRLDPATGRLFYLVATAAPANNGYQEVDAQSGELLAAWGGVDQISAGQGVGVKGDTKQLSNPAEFNTVGDLTDFVSGAYKLQSADGNFITYNANGTNSIPSQAMSDGGFNNDDKWNDTSQAAGVDAQYYAALTVQFYNQELGYDWLNDCTIDSAHGTTGWPSKVRSVVHYDPSPNGVPYDNAFWDEQNYYMVYGDGSTIDRPLSAGQDVVSHELSHAVTQCRENLVYRSESGALNESFSDIMATAAEFTMDEATSSHCWLAVGQTQCPDWLIGEDLARTASGAAIRNLADPGAEGQPSHYQDRSYATTPPDQCFSGSDYCDVHYNSGIPNHAFYLMVGGGRNARCSGPTDPQDDCDVVVPPTSLDHATKIFFAGFGLLTTDATMCDARNSTIAQAALLYPGSVTDIAATILAWQAVGLGSNCDASTDFTVSLSDPTVELAPGHAGQTQLSLLRLTDTTGTVNFTVDKVGPATVGANPTSNGSGDSSGAQISVSADNDAADGAYPILVTATDSPHTHYAAATMIIDAEPPSAAVSDLSFISMQTVSTGGAIPLGVAWTATDGQSGIASAELDHSPNGSGWVAIYGPGAVSSPTQYPATAGPHEFQVIATDDVGNTTTSPALIGTLSAYQETAATYTGKWLVSTSATPWGQTRYSTQRKATATLTFTGTDVVWIAQRGPKRGAANVFVDGVKTHVDLYAVSLSERRVVFVAANLSAGQHTIKIKVKATSGRPRVDVDGFFVLG